MCLSEPKDRKIQGEKQPAFSGRQLAPATKQERTLCGFVVRDAEKTDVGIEIIQPGYALHQLERN